MNFQPSSLIKQDGDNERNSAHIFSWRLVAVLVESSRYVCSK